MVLWFKEINMSVRTKILLSAIFTIASGACFASDETPKESKEINSAAVEIEIEIENTDQILKPTASTVSIVGNWRMTYDWNCDGTAGVVSWSVTSDGNFISSSGSYGTWQQIGSKVIFNYSGGTKYTGKLRTDNKMNGTSLSYSGSTGCWSAKRK